MEKKEMKESLVLHQRKKKEMSPIFLTRALNRKFSRALWINLPIRMWNPQLFPKESFVAMWRDLSFCMKSSISMWRNLTFYLNSLIFFVGMWSIQLLFEEYEWGHVKCPIFFMACDLIVDMWCPKNLNGTMSRVLLSKGMLIYYSHVETLNTLTFVLV